MCDIICVIHQQPINVLIQLSCISISYLFFGSNFTNSWQIFLFFFGSNSTFDIRHTRLVFNFIRISKWILHFSHLDCTVKWWNLIEWQDSTSNDYNIGVKWNLQFMNNVFNILTFNSIFFRLRFSFDSPRSACKNWSHLHIKNHGCANITAIGMEWLSKVRLSCVSRIPMIIIINNIYFYLQIQFLAINLNYYGSVFRRRFIYALCYFVARKATQTPSQVWKSLLYFTLCISYEIESS